MGDPLRGDGLGRAHRRAAHLGDHHVREQQNDSPDSLSHLIIIVKKKSIVEVLVVRRRRRHTLEPLPHSLDRVSPCVVSAHIFHQTSAVRSLWN